MLSAGVYGERIEDRAPSRSLFARWSRAFVWGIVAHTMPVRATAQDTRPTECKLKPATGTLNEEFIAITSIRELHDGRILVTDRRDHRVVIADCRTQEVKQIGRPGAGPAEYPIAAPLRALGGDSSIMLDGTSRRWLLFDADRIVGIRTNREIEINTTGLLLGGDTVAMLLQSPPKPCCH
jgi:hypothetical protein